MIEKLLTLLSGNTLLVRKAIEEGNEKLVGKIESLQEGNSQSSERMVSELSRLSDSMLELADAVNKRPAIEVNVPDVIVPPITVPDINAPVVNVNVPDVIVPEIKLPTINVPAPVVTVTPEITVTPTPVVFPKEMVVTGMIDSFKNLLSAIAGISKAQVYTNKDPLPVAFIDRQGRRYDLIHLGGQGVGGGGVAPSEITGADKTMRTVAFEITATGIVIPAVAGRRIKVYAVKLVTSAAVSVAFRSGASTLLEGMQPYIANAGFIDNIQPPAFLFATAAGEALHLVQSGAGTVSGRISYWDDDKV